MSRPTIWCPTRVITFRCSAAAAERSTVSRSRGIFLPSCQLVGDECHAFSIEHWTDVTLWEAEHIPSSSFVSRERVVEQAERSSGMRARRWVASDGSWELEGFQDVERGGACQSLNPAGVPPGACIPYPRATPWDGYYDSQCSVLGAARGLGEDSGCWLGEPPRSIYVPAAMDPFCPRHCERRALLSHSV